ncbi:iron-containing alcohol dehydrogenase family protein [Haladaptatus sp. NG-WS-4]
MVLFTPPPPTYHERSGIDTLSSLGLVDRADSVAVITDRGVRKAGLLEPIHERLSVETVFDEVESNPTVETVRAVRNVTEEADVVVGVGGGSVMDATKAGCALPAFGSFDALRPTSPDSRPPSPGMDTPTVLVPTTAGTGTETGHWAVISDHDANVKTSIGHSTLRAETAILDPELTTSLPPYLTAITGFDVVTHAIEAFVSSEASPLTDPYASETFDVAVSALPRAVTDGDDVLARERMLNASYLAGLAMNNAGLGAVHAISHAVGGLYDTPHGHTNALLLPHVVTANASTSERARLRYSRLVNETDAPGQELASRIETLLATLDLETSLQGAPEDWDWDTIATRALQNINMETNPTTFDHETVVSICREAFT